MKTRTRGRGAGFRISKQDSIDIGILAPSRLSGNREHEQMNTHQIRLLMHRFGMTEAQAQAIAALVWGAA
ncbi:hypothetical protein [Salipiger thiooxidans]|uniref:hypothetical protein n=1 Tax=Salipiger thiooxidans TaxID=282683 RepID=UPI001CFB8B40|nr:hypothetical protein [Salipiger thiooxidans]